MINRFSGLLGYEKTLTPDNAKRALEQLSRLYLFTVWNTTVNDVGNEIISEAEFIAYCLQTGRMPKTSFDRKCSKCYKNNCTGETICPKGKTVYSIGDEKFGMFISKAGYDFANHLISAGLITYEAVQAVIDSETAHIEKPVYEAETTEPDRDISNDAAQNTEDEYDAWLHERIINYGSVNLLEAAKMKTLREIFLDILCKYDDYFDKKLLVLIDNIENHRCRRDLIFHLQSANKASRQAFEHITGIKLPKSNNDIRKLLDNTSSAEFSLHPQEYVLRNAADRAEFSDRFYMYVLRKDKTKGFIESRGKLWHYNGSDFFIQKDHGGTYKASEGKTGLMVKDKCASIDTLKEAITSTLATMGTKYTDHITNALKASGVSPLYTA